MMTAQHMVAHLRLKKMPALTIGKSYPSINIHQEAPRLFYLLTPFTVQKIANGGGETDQFVEFRGADPRAAPFLRSKCLWQDPTN